MMKMNRTRFVIGATLTAGVAFAGAVGAQTYKCPDPVHPNTDNQINNPPLDGHWHGTDCWAPDYVNYPNGPFDYAHGATIARGRVYLTSTGFDLQAALFQVATSARIQGWTSQGPSANCFQANTNPNGTFGAIAHKTSADCPSVQNFRVVGIQ